MVFGIAPQTWEVVGPRLGLAWDICWISGALSMYYQVSLLRYQWVPTEVRIYLRQAIASWEDVVSVLIQHVAQDETTSTTADTKRNTGGLWHHSMAYPRYLIQSLFPLP
jgi:hypothetical protein